MCLAGSVPGAPLGIPMSVATASAYTEQQKHLGYSLQGSVVTGSRPVVQ